MLLKVALFGTKLATRERKGIQTFPQLLLHSTDFPGNLSSCRWLKVNYTFLKTLNRYLYCRALRNFYPNLFYLGFSFHLSFGPGLQVYVHSPMLLQNRHVYMHRATSGKQKEHPPRTQATSVQVCCWSLFNCVPLG